MNTPPEHSRWIRFPVTRRAACLVVASIVFIAVPLLSPAAAIDIGSRRELFVDRHLIGELRNASLRLHTPQLAPPVSPPRPNGHYATILRDGDRFQFYYRGYKVPGLSVQADGWEAAHAVEVTLYAESRDAIHWTLPRLGRYEHPAFPEGNVVLDDEFLVTHNFSPFIDTRPGVPPHERYKGIGGHKFGEKYAKLREKYGPAGMKAFVSPDGIHWRRMRDEPVIPEAWGAFDSQNVAFWFEGEGMYVCYFRVVPPNTGRSIARTTSKDFFHWTEPVIIMRNAPGEELYTNGTQPYFRAPHICVALPTRYMAKRGSATDIAFMSTRGGDSYDRTFMESLIRPGLGMEAWANRANYAAIGIHETGPGEMSILLTGGRRYTLRLDGFASVNAPFAGGELVTNPLVFSGRELEINYSTSAGGQIRIEIQDMNGKPLPGFALADCAPIFGDEIGRVVKWKNGTDVAAVAGKPVRLRFAMEDADVYSFKFN